jgi:haloalkane dehalogenase
LLSKSTVEFGSQGTILGNHGRGYHVEIPKQSEHRRKTMTKQNVSAAFPYKPNYIEILGAKMHFVDEGAGEPILFLHGNPTSSYLWRNIIPHLASLGRCIALDLIGMGKSDKPDLEYRFFDHVRYVEGFIETMSLKNITLVIHDWGSGIGFHYAMRHENNVKGIAFMEAIIMSIPSWDMFPSELKEIFRAFRTPDVGWDMIVNKNMFVEEMLPGGIIRKLTEEEMKHYREPFKDPASRKPIWRWPNEIPIEGEPPDVTKAVNNYNRRLQQSELPKLLFYATPGAILPPLLVEWCQQNLKNLSMVNIGPGVHFLQEDNPHLIGSELARWYKNL